MFPVFQLSKQDCRGKDRSENMGDGFAFDSDNDPFKFTPTSNGNSPKKGGYQAEFDKFAYHSPEHASHFEVDTKLSGEIKPGETGLSSLNTSSSDFESEEMSGVKLESSVVKPESKEFHIEGKYSDSKELVDFPIIKQDFSKIEIPNNTVIPSKLCKSTIVSDKLEQLSRCLGQSMVVPLPGTLNVSPHRSQVFSDGQSLATPSLNFHSMISPTKSTCALFSASLASISQSSAALPSFAQYPVPSTILPTPIQPCAPFPDPIQPCAPITDPHQPCAPITDPQHMFAPYIPTPSTLPLITLSTPQDKADLTLDQLNPSFLQKARADDQPSSKLYRGKLSFFKQAISQEISTMQETERLAKVQQENNKPIQVPESKGIGLQAKLMQDVELGATNCELLVSVDATVPAQAANGHQKDCHSDSFPREKVLGDKVPRDKVPRDKVPRDKIPRDKIPGESDKAPRDKIPRDKIPGESDKAPRHKITGATNILPRDKSLVTPNNVPRDKVTVTPEKVVPILSKSPEKQAVPVKDLPTNVVRKAIKRPLTAQIVQSSPLLQKSSLKKSSTTPVKKPPRVVHSINANPIPVVMNGHKMNVVKIEKHHVTPVSQTNQKDVSLFKLSNEQQNLGSGQQGTYPIAFTDYLKVQQHNWKRRKLSASEVSPLDTHTKKMTKCNIASPTKLATFSPSAHSSTGATSEIVKVDHSVLSKSIHLGHTSLSPKQADHKAAIHKQTVHKEDGHGVRANLKKSALKQVHPVKCKKSGSLSSISRAKKTLQNKILSQTDIKSVNKIQSRPSTERKQSTSSKQCSDKLSGKYSKKLALNKLSANQLTHNQLTQNQLSQNQLSQNQLTQNQLTQNQLTSNQLTSNQLVSTLLASKKPAPIQLTPNKLALNQAFANTNVKNNCTTNPTTAKLCSSELMPDTVLTNSLETKLVLPASPVAPKTISIKHEENMSEESILDEHILASKLVNDNDVIKEELAVVADSFREEIGTKSPQNNSVIKTEGIPTPSMSTLSDPKNFIKVEPCPDGEATVVRLDMDKFEELNYHQQNLIVDYFFEVTFGETDGVADHVMGIISNGSKDMPNVMNFLVKNAPGLKINHQILGKKDVMNCTIDEYYNKIKKNHSKCIYHEGGMQHVSLVGTKSEESGSYFPELVEMMEANPFFEVTLPWGSLSRYDGLDPSLSNDGPIFWVRPGEQFLQSTSGSRNHKGYRLLKNRETLVEDRTTPHADHSWDDGKTISTTAAAAFLQSVELPGDVVNLEKSLKDVIAFDARNFYQLAEELQLDLYEPPMTQCDIWIEDAKLNHLRESDIKYARIRLKANDMYFIPRNVVHQFKTVAACSSVAWHVRLKQYYDD